MSAKKDKKSPDEQANDRAVSQLKSKHAAEFDELKKQAKEKQKETEGKGGGGR